MSRQDSGSSIMVNLRAVAHSSWQHRAGPRTGDPFDDVSVHRAMARDAGFVGAVAHHVAGPPARVDAAIFARAIRLNEALRLHLLRDAVKDVALARVLGNGPRPERGAPTPAGVIVIVILAVLFDSAVPVVSKYGDARAGKIIININFTNPTRRQLRLNSSPHPARAPSRLKGSRLRRAVPLPWGWLCRRGRPRWRRRWRGSRC